MPGVSQFERLQIDAVLLNQPRDIETGAGLFVSPADADAKVVLDLAVLPAMRRNRLNARGLQVVFHDASVLADVCRFILTAELVVIDLAALNPAVLYVLGLSHGVGRCPILLAPKSEYLPFNLEAFRLVRYEPTKGGLFELRERLERVLRVFLVGSRAGGQ
jgi:hypothetical protein